MSRSNDWPSSVYSGMSPPYERPGTPSAHIPLQTVLCKGIVAVMASDSVVRPTAAGLRALSHPTRLKILMRLRVEGPATATTLARELSLNTGATSYHLRQLAEHGFIVEDAERGDARDRWWKAAHRSTLARLSDRR